MLELQGAMMRRQEAVQSGCGQTVTGNAQGNSRSEQAHDGETPLAPKEPPVSSSYYILCLSHDPATTAREIRSAEEAADAIRAGIDGHRDCDLLIERVSGGPVEYGCPPQGTRAAGPPCHHRDVEWADVDWLRLLGRAHASTDPGVRDAVRKGRFFCWTPDRLHRLRHPLRNEEDMRASLV